MVHTNTYRVDAVAFIDNCGVIEVDAENTGEGKGLGDAVDDAGCKLTKLDAENTGEEKGLGDAGVCVLLGVLVRVLLRAGVLVRVRVWLDDLVMLRDGVTKAIDVQSRRLL